MKNNDEKVANYRRKDPSCNRLDPSPFGMVLASLRGESLGYFAAVLKSDFLQKSFKNNS
jgi:hypothetical protein